MDIDRDAVDAKVKLILGEQAHNIAMLQAGFEELQRRNERLEIELTEAKSAPLELKRS